MIKEGQVLGHSLCSYERIAPTRTPRRWAPTITAVAVIMTLVSAGVSLAPSARADRALSLRDAVASVRGAASCGPLNYNSVVEQAAEISNQWTDDWIMHTATKMPNSDPLPALQDLGYRGTKAKLLSGAGRNEADAIKGALLEGYAAIPDCSYTEFGVSIQRNDTVGYDLTSIVLAGP